MKDSYHSNIRAGSMVPYEESPDKIGVYLMKDKTIGKERLHTLLHMVRRLELLSTSALQNMDSEKPLER
jgi:hypothetical protein